MQLNFPEERQSLKGFGELLTKLVTARAISSQENKELTFKWSRALKNYSDSSPVDDDSSFASPLGENNDMCLSVSRIADEIVKRQTDFVMQAWIFVLYARVHPDTAPSLLAILRQRESPTQQLWQRFDLVELEAIGRGFKTASRTVQ